MRTLLILVALAFATFASAIDVPILRDPVVDAYNHCILHPKDAEYLRYLFIGKSDRKLAYETLASHVNRLSVDPDITLPEWVTQDILVIDIRNYRWSKELWDRLQDPYFLVTVKFPGSSTTIVDNSNDLVVFMDENATLTVNNTTYTLKGKKRELDLPKRPLHYTISDGKETIKVVIPDKKGAIVRFGAGKLEKAFTPFCDVETAKKLIDLTQSKIPIVDGRWFYNQTAISVDRNPGYYDFLGIKNEKDFDKLLGFDPKVLESYPREFREAVQWSTVTHQPRRIDRAGTVGGGYWRTSDNRAALGDNNPLRVFDDELVYDARESFGHLPNGLLAWGLFNNKGVRQDSAPDFIASDSTAPGTDRRVHINLSCIRCHATGIQDIAGWARSIYAAPNAFPGFVKQGDKVIALSYEDYKKQKRFYLTRLEQYITVDRTIYANAVLVASGKTVQLDAANHARFWREYEEAKVDITYIARDLNCKPEVFVNALEHQLKTVGYLDPLLANFRGPKLPIRIHQWEELYPTAQTIVRGYATP